MELKKETIGKFIDASVNDQVEAKRLLEAYPELRQACWMGDESLFFFLVIENFPTAVSFCAQHGFDVNQTDGDMGTTPLHCACTLNYSRMAKILLKAGAKPNTVCQINDTPIHCAVRNGNANLVDLLIEHGADPNYRTELDETIFDNWPSWAESELVKVLEKHGVERAKS